MECLSIGVEAGKLFHNGFPNGLTAIWEDLFLNQFVEPIEHGLI